MRKHLPHLKPIKQIKSPKARVGFFAIVGLFAITGVWALTATHAANLSIAFEAESGQRSGNQADGPSAGASQNASVLFGAPGSGGGSSSDGGSGGGGDIPLPNPSVTGPISNPMSGKCLDVENGVASATAAIRIWPCNGSAAQNWTVAFTDDGSVQLQAVGMCLTSVYTAGQQVPYLDNRLQPCDDRKGELWQPFFDGSQIINLGNTALNKTDVCLDVRGSGTADGTEVGQYNCLANPAQAWQLPTGYPYVSFHYMHFKSDQSFCMDLPSGNTASGTQMQIWTCNNQPPQYLAFGLDRTGRAKVTVLDQCLEAKDGSTADGTPVQINTCSNNTAQNWQVSGSASDFSVVNMKSGKCLDSSDGTVGASKLLVLYACSGNAGQHFVE